MAAEMLIPSSPGATTADMQAPGQARRSERHPPPAYQGSVLFDAFQTWSMTTAPLPAGSMKFG